MAYSYALIKGTRSKYLLWSEPFVTLRAPPSTLWFGIVVERLKIGPTCTNSVVVYAHVAGTRQDRFVTAEPEVPGFCTEPLFDWPTTHRVLYAFLPGPTSRFSAAKECTSGASLNFHNPMNTRKCLPSRVACPHLRLNPSIDLHQSISSNNRQDQDKRTIRIE